MEHSLDQMIRKAYKRLTNVEKIVAAYVLENAEQVIYMSITDLADACQVGDSSIYRFCRTMGFQGYQDFKMKLALWYPSSVDREEPGEKKENTSGENLAECIMQHYEKVIKETYLLMEEEDVLRVVSMIEQARRVFFFGIGDSLLVAQHACNKFLRITGKVSCITDPHMQSMAASTSSKEDLILVISYSGATKDNIYVVKEAKKAGAKIACITHYKKSPLTTYSDAVILCGSKERSLEAGSLATQIGQLFLVDVIYQTYFQRNQEECKKIQEETLKAIMEKLY